jgi:predicted DNA-binding transcriptional regulator YafY
VAGIEEASVRALAKLEQVLPSRLRHRVGMLHAATVSVPGSGPAVSPAVLTAIAGAIRARERLRFDYESFHGTAGRREVEPHRLVHTRGRWYLVAWDVDRDDWRTFRADRLRPRTPNGRRFTPRGDPGGELAGYLERGVGTATWQYRARVTVHAPAAEVAARLPAAVVVAAVDEQRCTAEVGSDSAHELALWLGLLDADFDVSGVPELAEQVRRLADRYARAVGPIPPS